MKFPANITAEQDFSGVIFGVHDHYCIVWGVVVTMVAYFFSFDGRFREGRG